MYFCDTNKIAEQTFHYCSWDPGRQFKVHTKNSVIALTPSPGLNVIIFKIVWKCPLRSGYMRDHEDHLYPSPPSHTLTIDLIEMISCVIAI